MYFVCTLYVQYLKGMNFGSLSQSAHFDQIAECVEQCEELQKVFRRFLSVNDRLLPCMHQKGGKML